MSTALSLASDLLDVIAREDPLHEFIQGLPGYDHLLSDHDEAAEQELRRRAADLAARAGELDPDGPDRVTQAVVAQQADALVDRIDARLVEHTMADYLLSPVARLLTMVPAARPITVTQEQSYLARLAAIPGYLAGVAQRHRAGVAAGRTPVAERVRYATSRIDMYLADPAGDPLRQPPLTGPRVAERDRLLQEVVRPAFVAYREALDAEIAPHGRPPEQPGLCWLPQGEANYAALARMHTTTGHTPEQLHQIGLDLVEQLAEEYVSIGSRVFGVRTAAEVQHRLRTDTTLRWSGAAELLASARSSIERAELIAPKWFGMMPSHRCVVEPTPEADAPNAAAAWYTPAALDGSRPGTFLVNTYLATERDRYVSEALTFHEAVPGHHFQITIAQELAELPPLRRLVLINAYSEGWGLYAERLADEMGLYSDDIARLGMLAMDSTRAARLVVDTGLHAFGWSRQRVLDYLRNSTVMAEVEIRSETDRYIEMPGQALSYMVGRLELQRLRTRAERELGAAFDIQAFHDLVLGGGALPMAVLDDVVARWTAQVRNGQR
ncbi:uncharacterized protein (DUF885 family) [Actinoplanes campanulatus]|uniref:Uncharacterized protein (DUF885 family) n=1 Tax=Actinoplanes campanulatus TaxID=113559 RepID=A0A7W5AKG9_9ACTN|nr:DUF885 domain-containing protein [Actinoplanes campanulatus]MBB3097922.1 uncharacterized protein (DUF885 family) [Actinoplanes campanulatus]GGN22806.1 hypothetical protein GCM10010109_37520 [Actinoplanes campanulatus]GID34611.1 hypothetical protein Aca09nite_11170 [Actinoplanes campanulatus]